ncbi:MAG: ComF family protein [Acidimicrobiia bacterium]
MPAPAGPVAAVIAYEGAGRELMARLKYRNGRSALPALAAGMARVVDPWSSDVVTWAPTTAGRRRRRGYDQAELLARALARQLRLPVAATLLRVDGAPQTGRSRNERVAAAQSAMFVALRRVSGRVLVVDDVVTTGATLDAAARALRAAGAAEIRLVAAAATPRLDGRGSALLEAR